MEKEDFTIIVEGTTHRAGKNVTSVKAATAPTMSCRAYGSFSAASVAAQCRRRARKRATKMACEHTPAQGEESSRTIVVLSRKFDIWRSNA
jgi:hypothetical protein